MTAPIELLDIRLLNRESNVRAFLTIRIGGVTIKDCKVVQQPGQRAWASMPDRQYLDSSGSKRWTPIVELSPELRSRVNAVVAEHWSSNYPESGVQKTGNDLPF